MEPVMKSNSYGKGIVRMTRLTRGTEHKVFQVLCNVELEGDFEDSYTKGDNSKVVATDSMKNTIYALGADQDDNSAEDFGIRVCKHFISRYSHISKATIEIFQDLWDRVPTPSGPHPSAFSNRGNEKRYVKVSQSRGKTPTVQGGVVGLSVFRSAGSEFAKFVTDEFRTLPDTHDRIFATVVQAIWTYNALNIDFNATYRKMRSAMISVFADHHSLGVQHTMHEMGVAALKQCPEVEELSFVLPNKHHIPFDVSRLGGRKNRNEIFVATDEPHGQIKETIGRARSRQSKL
jgi:urate oxidase